FSFSLLPLPLRPERSLRKRSCRSRSGPTSTRTSSVRRVGARLTAVAWRFSPNRGLTSYRYRCVVGSNPRTYSSVGSTNDGAPQPWRLFEPCTSASMPVSGLAIPSEIVARSGSFSACDTSETRKLRLVDQGPSQLLRPAIVLSCDRRQWRTDDGAVLSRFCIAAASVGSVVLLEGSKMNARSSLYPSPFTSPDTIGVKGFPDWKRPNAV